MRFIPWSRVSTGAPIFAEMDDGKGGTVPSVVTTEEADPITISPKDKVPADSCAAALEEERKRSLRGAIGTMLISGTAGLLAGLVVGVAVSH